MANVCKGHEHIASLGTVKTLTLDDGTYEVQIQATGQNVWYTLDGSTPSATNGMILAANTEPTKLLATLAKSAKFLEASSGGKLNAVYFGPE